MCVERERAREREKEIERRERERDREREGGREGGRERKKERKMKHVQTRTWTLGVAQHTTGVFQLYIRSLLALY